MRDTLLKTKLYIPPSRPELVSRPHLIKRLNEGLYRKLILISAPPGFGKTTLLSEWIADFELDSANEPTTQNLKSRQRRTSEIENPKFAWVSLDEQDNDLVRFWSYVIAALDAVQADIGADSIALLKAPQAPPIETTLTTLINAITNVPHKFVLILDDYHVINDESIHRAVTFLLDHLPPHMHLVITSRTAPPLPLTRLRVRNQLTELGESDLRFTFTEAATFLNKIMGLNLSPDDIIALEDRTEGWIAGLHLAALSMQGHRDALSFVRDFTGSHRYVIDYLAEEVLARQPEPIQTFLLQTSILERLCGPLCDAVVRELEIGDWPKVEIGKKPVANLQSQAILEYLEQANLFLIPLDGERRWYRYHHLFADFLQEYLRQKIGNKGIVTLHRRASMWYAESGLTGPAVRHALAADDPEHAARLVEQVIIAMLTRGEVATVIGWLEALPEDLIHTRPRLALGQAWAMVITSQGNEVEPFVEDAEKGLLACKSAGDQDDATLQGMLGEVAALRAMRASEQGKVGQAIQLCQQALERLPEDNLVVRSIITMTLGAAYEGDGNLDKASQTLAEAFSISKAIDAVTIVLPAAGNLGRIQEELGQLYRAADFYHEIIQFVEKRAGEQGRPGQPVSISGWAYLSIAEIYREWNDLENAQRYLTVGMQMAQQLNFMGNTIAIGQLILARILQAQGDKVGAIQSIQQAEQAIDRHSPVYPWVTAIRARLWLAQSNLAAAGQWAQSCGLPLGEHFNYTQYPGEYSTLVRVLVAQERFEEALNLLQGMQAAAESDGRLGRLLEIKMLQSLTLFAQGHTEQALAPLTQALTLGEPGGYVRLFADEGPLMARLLRLAKLRGIAPGEAYLDRLLVALGPAIASRKASGKPFPSSSPAHSSPSAPVLVETLSERELEVLRLVANGLSNRDIAEKLVITVGTAKTHTINIYRKLDVRSRTQAVARATDLGLL